MSILKKIVEYMEIALSIYTFVITLIEEQYGGGNGDAKKKEAIAKIKETVQKAQDEGRLPGWLAWLLSFDSLLSFAIDIIVAVLNKLGVFEHQGNESGVPSNA